MVILPDLNVWDELSGDLLGILYTFEVRNVFLYTDIHVDLLLLMMQSLEITKSVECF